MSLYRSTVTIHKTLDEFHVWSAKYRHWMFEVAESGEHKIWVATKDLREMFQHFPDDQRLKTMCASFMFYAKDLKAHFIQDEAMHRIMGQIPRLKTSPEARKFLDWFDRNIGVVARNKRRNRALDEHNETQEHRSHEVLIGPLPGSLAPPHLTDPTRPHTEREQWRLDAKDLDTPRVYRPELRPLVMTWPQWIGLKAQQLAGYCGAIWRGERSLFETIVVGLLQYYLPLQIMSAILPEDLDFSRQYLFILWLNLGLMFFALGCAVLLAVSLMRCTRRSWALHGGWLWATTIFLVFIPLVPVVAGNGWERQLVEEWWDVVRGKNWPAQVYADPILGRIVITGEFRLGSADAFEAVVKANKKLRVVQIESPGGYVTEGFRMARLIEQYKLSTVSFEDCHSACTFLLVAGETRYLGPKVMVGFHRSGTKYGLVGDGWSWTDQRIARYYQSRGVRAAFIRRALTPSIREIWIAPHAQMYEAGYATMRWEERPAGL